MSSSSTCATQVFRCSSSRIIRGSASTSTKHTKRWSAKIDAADAFIFVTPEYNHGTPPSLINALDYLVHEWAHKPLSFVSYGGPAGGARAVQMVKPMLVALKMMPVLESVMVPFFAQSIDSKQVFTPSELQETHAKMMLDALAKWIPALAALRAWPGSRARRFESDVRCYRMEMSSSRARKLPRQR